MKTVKDEEKKKQKKQFDGFSCSAFCSCCFWGYTNSIVNLLTYLYIPLRIIDENWLNMSIVFFTPSTVGTEVLLLNCGSIK